MDTLTWKELTRAVNQELTKQGYKHLATPTIVAQVMITGMEIAKQEGTHDAADLVPAPAIDPGEAV